MKLVYTHLRWRSKSIIGVISVTLLMLLSCEKEMPVAPIAQSRTVVGTVVDSLTGVPIDGATISVVPMGPVQRDTLWGASNASGKFSISGVPILPSSQPFRLRIQAIGYVSKDTIVSCNCATLSAGVLRLRRLACLVQFQPAAISFGYVAVGRETTRTVQMTNPTPLSVVVEQIVLQPASPDLNLVSQSLPSLPLALGPQMSATLQVRFAPTMERSYSGTLKAITNCDPTHPSTALVSGNGESPHCNIRTIPSPPPLTFRVYTGTADTAHVLIQNISHVAVLNILSYTQSPPSPPFAVLPLQLPRTIQPGQTDTIRIIFNPSQPGQYSAQLSIDTDGDCDTTIDIIATGNARPSPKNGETLNRWLPGQNPKYMWKGVQFPEPPDPSKVPLVVPDSVDICSGVLFGQHQADFQFVAIDSTYYGYDRGFIRAFNGLQKVGNVLIDNLDFDAANYGSRIDPNSWESGCAKVFREGDVIAIRTLSGRSVLVLIKDFGRDLYNYDQLIWAYIVL
ncbi:MAG: choice-of-anchor D domain-containing protein [Bacteroidota bacterium]